MSADEDWKSKRGGTTEEYKDKNAHVVLKRTYNYLPATTSPIASATLQILSTYYVYDDLGNLCFVIPPLPSAVNADNVSPTQAILDELCYQYKYDEQNRLVEKKLPGKGWEYVVYNNLDQVVETQDAVQRLKTPQQASFVKYDALGRVVIKGIFNVPNSPTPGTNYRLAMQSDANAQAQWESRLNVGTSGTTDYTTVAAPVSDFTPLIINYYDSYTAIPGKPGAWVPTTPATYSTMTKGLLTATRTAVLNTPAVTLFSVLYYDDFGRNTATYAQHFKGGYNTVKNYDVVSITYNFSGQVTTTTRNHYIYDPTTTNSVFKLVVANRYLYDHAGRKIKTWQQITNQDGTATPTSDSRVLVSKLDYNEIGQLWNKNLHSTDSAAFMQTVINTYNERGWLLSRSSNLFREDLQYNTGQIKDGMTPAIYYNGNIASQTRLSGTPQTSQTYIYDYDQLNRLKDGKSSDNFNETGIAYDRTGNIVTLMRYNGSAASLMDNLTYSYLPNSNKLTSISDAVTTTVNPTVTEQKAGISNYNYTDNANGNLTADGSKAITNIIYNVLNLPQTITGNGSVTTYTYDANGQKLRRVITGTGAAATDYVGGIQYTAAAMEFIRTEEGMAIPQPGTPVYNYEYSLTDHIGNSRVNFDTYGHTSANPVQIDDYYPFGIDINKKRGGTTNDYLYNGKELQENNQLYDYGARFYDPVIARWTTPDPLAEISRRYSPYNYVENNPIRNIDPDGMACEGCDIGQKLMTWEDFRSLDLFDREKNFNDELHNQENLNKYLGNNGVIAGPEDGGKGGKGPVSSLPTLPNGDKNAGLLPEVTITPDGSSANQGGAAIDWKGAGNAFLGVLGGVAETTLGVLTAETGVGGFAIVDGGSRTLFNAIRLVGYFTHSKSFSEGPSNLGGYFGKALDNMPYTSGFTNGKAQFILGATNDLGTFLITGGNGDSWRLIQEGTAIEKAASVTTIGVNFYSVGNYGGKW